MVVGGWDAEYDVEIVDLSGRNATCRKPADIPIKYASTGMYFDGRVMVCGGKVNSSTTTQTQECYQFDENVSNFSPTLNVTEPFSLRATNGSGCPR